MSRELRATESQGWIRPFRSTGIWENSSMWNSVLFFTVLSPETTQRPMIARMIHGANFRHPLEVGATLTVFSFAFFFMRASFLRIQPGGIKIETATRPARARRRYRE